DYPPQDPNVRELLACLLQELVLRGVDVRRVAPLPGHPLARLPLRLQEIESELTELLPSFCARGHSRHGLLSLAASGGRPFPTTTTDSAHVAEAGSVESMVSAVRDWTTASNGACEARVFTTVCPIVLSMDFLRSLHLACLGADIRGDVVS